MLQQRFSLLFALLFLSGIALSQELPPEPVQKISISEGLAHNGVTSILQDSRGYLWFGTYDGLNQYDGYDVKVFKNTVEQELLVSNRVRTISEDQDGNLWIGTDEGISIYDFTRQQFRHLYSHRLVNKGINGPVVRKIILHPGADQVLCATEKEGVLVFDRQGNFSGQYFPSHDRSLIFYDGLALDARHYLFATSGGLLLYEADRQHFRRILSEKLTSCTALFRGEENALLVAQAQGLAVLDINSREGAYDFAYQKQYFRHLQINNLAIDRLGGLWISSLRKGITHVREVELLLKAAPPSSISYTRIRQGLSRASTVLPTTEHGCWVGTFNNGLLRFDLGENPFTGYTANVAQSQGLITNDISHIYPLDQDRAYITTIEGGTRLFNAATASFESLPFPLSDTDQLQVAAIFVDSHQHTWLRFNGGKGLRRVRPGATTIERVAPDFATFLNNIAIRSITEDQYGHLWVGAVDEVYKLTLDENRDIRKVELLNEHPLLKNDKINLFRTVYADPQADLIWIGTDAKGLLRVWNEADVSLSELEIDQYLHQPGNAKALPSNFVSTIKRLPDGSLWLGTERGGLCQMTDNEGTPQFHTYSEKDGLSNNVVKNILYDDEFNLWVSTNIGLNKFDTQSHSFRTFRKEDGLPFEDFDFSATALENGYFLFSGQNGFCAFHPEQIKPTEVLPALEFGEFRIFNRTILPGDTVNRRVLLQKRLEDGDEIELKHHEDVFSIEVKALHFSTADHHYLRYQLLPLNREWIKVPSSQRTIYYSGLQPGEYTLHVAASNSLNDWTESKSLRIVITPPFWKTGRAYALYVLLAALLLGAILFVILRIQALNHKLEIERIEKENVKSINEAKLRFFSNISHEIKTPLTLISGPVDQLAKKFKDNFDLRQKLQMVQRQSKKLLGLIDQVHDFQKADAEFLSMQYSRFCFDDFIRELAVDFEFPARGEKKQLLISDGQSPIYVSADRDKLEKIFNNLLTNALKFTQAGDQISIRYHRSGKDLIVTVEDTGTGIEAEDLPHIFERFYQTGRTDRAHPGGSGIGLAFAKRLVEMHYGSIVVESEWGKGTTFIIRLPVVKEPFAEDQDKREEAILSAEHHQHIEAESLRHLIPAQLKTDGRFSEVLIFLAEDNTDMRRFISETLSEFFRIKAFANGQECLQAMETEWPDLVISDVLMPILNGLELCKRLKADIKTSHIPVILLTACTTIEDQIQGIRDGADAYLKKPFNVQHLVTTIEALLLNRKQLRERFQIGIPLTHENNKNNRNDNAFLEKLYELMADNLDNQNLDLDSFAQQLFLNRTHFFQKVKALTDHTPYELMKLYRLKKAAELLSEQNLSVNEVYTMTGFKSRTHFSRLFKEHFKVTPGKYGKTN